MIGDKTETFTITIPAVHKTSTRKFELRQVPALSLRLI